MLAAFFIWVALQTDAPPVAAASEDGSKTVIVAPDAPPEGEAPLSSRIGRERPAVLASDPVAAMHLREWANCVVRTKRRDALALLATAVNSPEQAGAIASLTESRFGWRSLCVRTRMMEVDNLVLRGAIAEALYRWEVRRGRSAGPLVQPPAPQGLGGAPSRLIQAGECVVAADPAGVAALMDTRPGSETAHITLEALAPKIDECLPNGSRAWDFHPLMLRSVLGEPFYRNSRALR